MKGLLKGLRYFTHMFESEKEPEMKIGLPTDVKHVAHIGMDGPSAVQSKPSWMNEFQTPAGGFQTPPASLGGEVSVEDPVKWGSQDNHSLSRKGSAAKDMPQLPKSSKRTTSTNGSGVSSTKEKTDKSKQSKKTKKPKDSNQATESTSKEPKKSKRKKVKELGGEGSSRRSRATDSDTVSESGSQFSYASEFIEGDNT
ncbi:ROP-interactive CRIB motif-containing protein 6 [Hibiscus trionum]|uniref:ROP-interactive CRIB motif-containing protein 6 n=1 Tax=Hibiscus trionum TaxID=183268 RepID=A0A9W7H2K6_HIBTR|nr:ROP-interactive CRIB motif-containing protein 6 [Hibiscus trionum]